MNVDTHPATTPTILIPTPGMPGIVAGGMAGRRHIAVAIKAFNEGKQAYRNGLSLDSNPYPYGSAAQKDWQAGWTSAYYQDMMQSGARGAMDDL